MITPCLILHWNQKNAKGPLWALWFVHSGLQWEHSGATWKTNSCLLKCKRLIQVILHKGKQNSKYHILLLPVEPPKSYTLRCTHSFVRSIMVKLNHVWYTEKKKENRGICRNILLSLMVSRRIPCSVLTPRLTTSEVWSVRSKVNMGEEHCYRLRTL